MSAKIKLSYTDDRELERVRALLAPSIQKIKVPKGQKSPYKLAYIWLKTTSTNGSNP